MDNLKALILAAGEGVRMKSKIPKVLHKILDKAMLRYVVSAARSCGISEIGIVIGYKAEMVKDELKGENISFFLQEKQMGTGHAALSAESFIDEASDILILYGDTPLITDETLKRFIRFHKENKNDISLISAVCDNPSGYGRIIRDKKGRFLRNIEHKDASEEERQVKEINTGVYCFNGKALKETLGKISNNNAQGEYYLTDTLSEAISSGYKVNVFLAEGIEEFLGVNSREQLAEASGVMRRRINLRHMENGVTLIDPLSTYISPEVTIGEDTVIYPGVILEGKTSVGRDSYIGPYCRLKDVIIGDNTTVKYTWGEKASVGNISTIGPFAYLRPDSDIGNNVKIGDFVEVKNSSLGDGTKVSHLTYIGDSDVGENVNFGCGTVTVNYNGREKYRTVIGDNVFIGCNTNLVAPVKVENDTYIAAGSTITEDVPEKSLAIARARQVNIKNWELK